MSWCFGFGFLLFVIFGIAFFFVWREKKRNKMEGGKKLKDSAGPINININMDYIALQVIRTRYIAAVQPKRFSLVCWMPTLPSYIVLFFRNQKRPDSVDISISPEFVYAIDNRRLA